MGNITLQDLIRLRDKFYKMPILAAVIPPDTLAHILIIKDMSSQAPRHRLTELIFMLPKRWTRTIADRCHCSPTTVSNVLNGKQTQNSDLARNIIRVAERMVRR